MVMLLRKTIMFGRFVTLPQSNKKSAENSDDENGDDDEYSEQY